MKSKRNFNEEFKSKKDFYNHKLLELGQEDGKKSLDLKIKKEKLSKGKDLLKILSGLVDERSEKADKISQLIKLGKNRSSETKDVNDINDKIIETQNSLKFVKDFSEGFSSSIAGVLGEEVSKDMVSKALKGIDDELIIIENKIIEEKEKEEEREVLKGKYERCIAYIDKYLDGSKFMNSLKADLVYKYAEKEGMDDIKEKMEARSLSLEEYEEILIKINPLYAYIVHKINTGGDMEKQESYRILENMGKGIITNKDKKDLENETKKWLITKNEVKDAFTSREKEDNPLDIEEIIKKVPENKNSSQQSKDIKNNNIRTITEILKKVEGEKNLRILAEALKEKGRPNIIKMHDKFSFLRKEKINKDTKDETGGVFDNKNQYDEFKSKKHNSDEALHLIESGASDFLISHLEYFEDLNKDVFENLVTNEKIHDKLLANYSSFGIEINEFILILLKNNLIGSKIRILGKMNNLNSDVALQLIKNGDIKVFIKLLEEGWFIKLSSKVSNILFQKGTEWKTYIWKHPELFDISEDDFENSLNSNIEALIKSKKYRDVMAILENNEWKNKEKYVLLLIEKGGKGLDENEKTGAGLIAYHIDKISGINHNKVAKKLVELQKFHELGVNLGKFKDLDKSIALELVAKGYSGDVAKELNSFKQEVRLEIFKELLKHRKSHYHIANNLEKFRRYMSDEEIATEIIENDGGWIIAQNKILTNFTGLSDKVFYGLLDIQLREGLVTANIAENIDSFDEKYHRIIMQELVEHNGCGFVIKYLKKFKGLTEDDYNNIFYTQLNGAHYDFLVYYLDKFPKNPKQQKDLIIFLTKKQKGNELIYQYKENFTCIPDSRKKVIENAYKSGGTLYINDENELDYKLNDIKNLDKFDTNDIVHYVENDYSTLSDLLVNIDSVSKKNQKEIIKRVFGKNIRVLTNWLSKLTKQEWKEKYNYFDREMINYLIKYSNEDQKKWYFILSYFDRFNIVNKKGQLFGQALKNLNNVDVEKAIRYKGYEISKAIGDGEFALTLINNNYGDLIIKYYKNFKWNDNEVIFKLLIYSGYKDKLPSIYNTLNNTEKKEVEFLMDQFLPQGGRDKPQKAIKEKRQTKEKINNSEEIVKNITELATEKKWNQVIEMLNNNKSLITDELLEDINNSLGITIIKGKRKKFKYDENTTKKIIESGNIDEIAENMDKYQGLNLDIAKEVKGKWGSRLAYEISNFDKTSHQAIAEEIISKGRAKDFLINMQNFNITDYDKLVTILMNQGKGVLVIENLEKFKGLNHIELLDQLIRKGYTDKVISNINKFSGITRFEIAKKIIDSRQTLKVLENLSSFMPQLGEEYKSPLELINDDEWEFLSRELFRTRYRKALKLDQIIAFKLILNGYAKEVVDNIDSFDGIFNERITKILLQNGYEKEILEHFEKFEGLGFDFIEKIDDPEKLAENIRNFKLDFHDKIANYLINNGNGIEVAKNLYRFRGADREKLIDKLICSGLSEYIDYLDIGYINNGNTNFANKLREFFSEYILINEKLFKENYQEFRLKFQQKYGIYLFPGNWKSLLQVLGGKPNCTTVQYFKNLLKSKKEGDKYYSKYIIRKNQKRTVKDLNEVLALEKDDKGKEGLNQSETVVPIRAYERIKDSLIKWGIDSIFIDLITEENDGEIKINEVKEKFEEYKEKNKGTNLILDDILDVFEISGAEIIGKLDEEGNADLEDWSTIEEYSKENLGRIQKSLGLNNGLWISFKELIEENGEINREKLNKWAEENKFKFTEKFNKVMSHFGLSIIDENDEFDVNAKTPEEFVEKLEVLGYKCKNKSKFIENLSNCIKKITLNRLNDQVLKRLKDLDNLKKELKKKGIDNIQPEDSPFELITPTNRNPKFYVIKLPLSSKNNVPRVIFNTDFEVLTILSHKDYDRLRNKTKKKKIPLKGIENRNDFWG